MEICNKILHSYAIYCRKEMVKILKCYLIPKKSYDTLSKGAIFFGQPCTSEYFRDNNIKKVKNHCRKQFEKFFGDSWPLYSTSHSSVNFFDVFYE